LREHVRQHLARRDGDRTALLGFHTISLPVGKRLIRNDHDNAVLLSFYRDIGVSAKAGQVLIAADHDHLTWLYPDLATGLDIKMTLWPEKPTATMTAADREAAAHAHHWPDSYVIQAPLIARGDPKGAGAPAADQADQFNAEEFKRRWPE
jgi:hypothetical protein